MRPTICDQQVDPTLRLGVKAQNEENLIFLLWQGGGDMTNFDFESTNSWPQNDYTTGAHHLKHPGPSILVREILRVIYSYVRVLVTTKSSNLPSFWALTPERKVQLICAWSYIVGLTAPHLLKPIGKLSNLITILDNFKAFKIEEDYMKLLLMFLCSYDKSK